MPKDAIEIMVRAAISDAFQQRGLHPDTELSFSSAEQSYEFMGVDLLQSMRAAIHALEAGGWILSSVDALSSEAA